MEGKAVYDCYTFAIELGFTEAEARDLAATKSGKGQDATVLRRIARVKRPIDAKAGESIYAEPKKHKHYYRKDGTCKRGAVRRERKAKA